MTMDYMAAPGCRQAVSVEIKNYNNERLIFNAVCWAFGYPHSEVVFANNNIRKREYVIVRQVTMTLFRLKLKYTLEKIGQFFGEKDHVTVIHAIHTVKHLLDTNKEFRATAGHLFVDVTFPEKRKYIKKFIEREEE